jgi:hypothetical protein
MIFIDAGERFAVCRTYGAQESVLLTVPALTLRCAQGKRAGLTCVAPPALKKPGGRRARHFPIAQLLINAG